MISKWLAPMMWTLSLNASAYPDRARIYRWIKEKRCVSVWVQSLDRMGVLATRDWYAVMEFQDGKRNGYKSATEQVHFHVLLNTKYGFIEHRDAWAAWEKQAPPWRVSGTPLDKHGPAMGFVHGERIYDFDKVANYVCKYLAKGPGKLPTWFADMIDLQSTKHNLQLGFPSRGFFASLGKEKTGPVKRRARAERKRRPVADRLEKCGALADGYLCVSIPGVGEKRVWIDSAVYNWATIVEKLAGSMSEGQIAECERRGSIYLKPQEFARIIGMPGYLKLLEMTGGSGVGDGAFSEYEAAYLEKCGVPADGG